MDAEVCGQLLEDTWCLVQQQGVLLSYIVGTVSPTPKDMLGTFSCQCPDHGGTDLRADKCR